MPNVIAGGCGIMLLLLVLNTPGEVESGDGGAEVSSKFGLNAKHQNCYHKLVFQ